MDLSRCEIRLSETKAGRPHTVRLSTGAASILRDLPKALHNPYVFPGTRRGRPMDVKVPWLRIRKLAGLEDVRMHDLRRTVGSWLAMSGASLPLIGNILNHSNVATTQIYARFSDHPARAALEAHSERISAIANDREDRAGA